MAVRPTTLFLHSCQSAFQEPVPPFVAGLGANAVFPAQLTEVAALQSLHREFNSLVHFLGLFPRHKGRFSQPSLPAKVLPMFWTICVTHVLNLHRQWFPEFTRRANPHPHPRKPAAKNVESGQIPRKVTGFFLRTPSIPGLPVGRERKEWKSKSFSVQSVTQASPPTA